MLKEVFYFIVFVPGSLIVWTFSMSLGPSDFEIVLSRVFSLEVKAVMIALGPYLIFQFLRGILGGFSRKV
jgi:hypothetical protein